MKIRLLVLLLSVFVVTGCGGGGDGDSGETNVSPTSQLPAVDGYGIVTDIVSLNLNDDSYEDLVLFRTGDDPFYDGLYIQALINNGDKTFTDSTETYFSTIGNNWGWIDKAYLVDLNDDGLLDIVGHTDINGTLPPLIRVAGGGFEKATNQVLLDNCTGMIPIDSDADGDMDIIVRKVDNFAGEFDQVNQLYLLENTTTEAINMTFQYNGLVSTDSRVGWDYSSFAYSPVVIDIDNDGYQDLVYGGPVWQTNGFTDLRTPISIFINSTNNTFAESATSVFNGTVPSYTHVREMLVADFYGNGYKSIMVANTGYDWAPYPGQNNAILKNNGDGTLTEDLGNSTTHNYKGFTHSADAADIDNDGDIDIVYTDILGDDVSSNNRVRILKNDGSGVFTKESFSLSSSISSTSTKVVDLDSDGFPELVLGGIDSSSHSVIVWNDGTGSF